MAEVAEALNIPTSDVMASIEDRGVVSVFYTPAGALTDGVVIFNVRLKRDDYQILRPISEAKECPGLWKEIMTGILGQRPATKESR
jgi:hypothetical protein